MIFKRLFWWVPFGRVPEMSALELHEKMAMARKPHIIDVRTRQEWESGHITGAVNIPVTSLKQKIKHLDLPTDRPLVTICLSAHRSIPAVRLLTMAGFSDVYQLKGGMQAWWSENLPVARDRS